MALVAREIDPRVLDNWSVMPSAWPRKTLKKGCSVLKVARNVEHRASGPGLDNPVASTSRFNWPLSRLAARALRLYIEAGALASLFMGS